MAVAGRGRGSGVGVGVGAAEAEAVAVALAVAVAAAGGGVVVLVVVGLRTCCATYGQTFADMPKQLKTTQTAGKWLWELVAWWRYFGDQPRDISRLQTA